MSTSMSRYVQHGRSLSENQTAVALPTAGDFIVTMYALNRIHVQSIEGILVNGLLYPFGGQAERRPEGWRFWANTLYIEGKMAPKLKAEVVARITEEVDAYMQAHPEIMAGVAVRDWQQKMEGIRQEIRGLQLKILNHEAEMESLRRTQHERLDHLADLQTREAALLSDPPEGAEAPEYTKE